MTPFPTMLRRVLVQRDGALTRDLVQSPARFGLGRIPDRLQPDAVVPMVCGFCATGCSLLAHCRDGRAVNLSPNPAYPVNLGMACPKGWEALSVLSAPDRGTTPLVRDRRGAMVPVDWDAALRTFVDRIRRVQACHGPDSVAFLSTGQITCEEMAYLGALAKFGMGMIHGDGNTRQCMATAASAYKESFGFDAPPYSYEDLEQSDVLIFVGANPCIAHPILWERVCMNPHRPRIIVIDPRRTETAQAATHHLAIRPKSDLPLLYAVARCLLDRDWIRPEYIRRHTAGFEAFAAFLRGVDLDQAAADTGLARDRIEQLAEWIHQGRRVSFWWTMGINQSHEGTRAAQAIINLALMTGNIGRPGTGPNSITGQCNAMGSRLWSNTTNLLGGHSFTDPHHRAKVAGILGMEVSRIPAVDSLPYHRILEEAEAGRIKALWIVCTNPGHSWIDQNRFEALAQRLEFMVVQDMYNRTDTLKHAHLYLPAAGWGEKLGTFINSERRYGVIRKVRRAPGLALADFLIFRAIARYWGCADRFEGWDSPESVFRIMKELSRGQPCDITGIDGYGMIEREGGIQWPYPEGAAEPAGKARRLFAQGGFHHPDGRARFCFEPPRPRPEPADPEYPLILLTGRGSASQWHTQTRTAQSGVLRKLYPADPYVETHPSDARSLGLTAGDWVWIISRRGRFRARCCLTPTVQPGHLFIPMHYPGINRLTLSCFDPYSGQPSYKDCAVRISKTGFPAEPGPRRRWWNLRPGAPAPS